MRDADGGGPSVGQIKHGDRDPAGQFGQRCVEILRKQADRDDLACRHVSRIVVPGAFVRGVLKEPLHRVEADGALVPRDPREDPLEVGHAGTCVGRARRVIRQAPHRRRLRRLGRVSAALRARRQELARGQRSDQQREADRKEQARGGTARHGHLIVARAAPPTSFRPRRAARPRSRTRGPWLSVPCHPGGTRWPCPPRGRSRRSSPGPGRRSRLRGRHGSCSARA